MTVTHSMLGASNPVSIGGLTCLGLLLREKPTSIVKKLSISKIHSLFENLQMPWDMFLLGLLKLLY